MDSPHTAMTSTPYELKVLHLEPTDACQARCPSCARETDHDFDQTQVHHLTMQQIQNIVDSDHIARLDKMFMCGVYGDPAAGRHTLEIYRTFREINPDIVLGMNTNGGLQNVRWWRALGELLQHSQDYVIFSIDGLENTNHLYRRGVSWSRLMQNVQAYIATGAQAHWDMLIYRHNEHQVDACEQLARDLGFAWFRAKVSYRPLVAGLEAPLNWQPPTLLYHSIKCHAMQEQSLYIDAKGRQSPCCWLGREGATRITQIQQVMPTWNSDQPHPVCVNTCGKSKKHTHFEAQWIRERSLC